MSTENSTKEKLAIGGALVGGLMFFGFLSQGSINGSQEKTKTSHSIKHDTAGLKGDEKIRKLEELLKNDRYEASKEIARINDAHEKLLIELSKNKSLITALKAKNAENIALLSKFDEITEIDKADSLKKENLALKARLKKAEQSIAKMSGGKDLAELKEKNEVLNAKIKEINEALKKIENETGISVFDLAKQNEELVGDNKKLRTHLELEVMRLEDDKTTLKAQVNQFKAAKNVFVKSSGQLPKKAQNLLADLKTLEGKQPAEVAAAYQGFAKKHGAVSKIEINFASGSSEMTPEIIEAIKATTIKADKNAYFFIVGYADKTGDAANNQKLSSARATVTAKQLAKNAKGFQAAQAYYLGQTDRFGANDKNRIVEIWVLK